MENKTQTPNQNKNETEKILSLKKNNEKRNENYIMSNSQIKNNSEYESDQENEQEEEKTHMKKIKDLCDNYNVKYESGKSIKQLMSGPKLTPDEKKTEDIKFLCLLNGYEYVAGKSFKEIKEAPEEIINFISKEIIKETTKPITKKPIKKVIKEIPKKNICELVKEKNEELRPSYKSIYDALNINSIIEKVINETYTPPREEIENLNFNIIMPNEIVEAAKELPKEIIKEPIKEMAAEIIEPPKEIIKEPIEEITASIEYLDYQTKDRALSIKQTINEEFYNKKTIHGLYELTKYANKIKIFFDFDEKLYSNEDVINTSNNIKLFFLNTFNQAINILIQQRKSGDQIKAHFIITNIFIERHLLHPFLIILNKMDILNGIKIDAHPATLDQFRNTYFIKKKYSMDKIDLSTRVIPLNFIDFKNSFVTLIDDNTAINLTDKITLFNEENKHHLIKESKTLEQKEITLIENIDDYKLEFINYFEKLNKVKITKNLIFHNFGDKGSYILRDELHASIKKDLYLNKDLSGDPLTKAPIYFNFFPLKFTVVSMCSEQYAEFQITTKKGAPEEQLKEWITDNKNKVNYEEAILTSGKINLIQGAPGSGKTNLVIEHMNKTNGIKIIVESRLSQRDTHKKMIFKNDPKAIIIEIDGQHHEEIEFYNNHLDLGNIWIIVNDLSFYRVAGYIKNYIYFTGKDLIINILIDEANQIIGNLCNCNNGHFKTMDLKNLFFSFIEQYANTCYFTDLGFIEELKTLLTRLILYKEIDIINLKSKQTIKNLTFTNQQKKTCEKIYDLYKQGKKTFSFFTNRIDLQTCLNFFIKKGIKREDIYAVTGDHENLDFNQLDIRRVILTTSKIYNCISVKATNQDETFLFYSNKTPINNFNQLNSCLRMREAQTLTIVIDKKSAGQIHNKFYTKEKDLLKHNKNYYDYLNCFDNLTMIEAAKIIINRDEEFNLIMDIDEKKEPFKKKKIITINKTKTNIKKEVALLKQYDIDDSKKEIEEMEENIRQAKLKLKCPELETIEEINNYCNAPVENEQEKIEYLFNTSIENINPNDIEDFKHKLKLYELKEIELKFQNDIMKEFKIYNEPVYNDIKNFTRTNNLNINMMDFERKKEAIDTVEDLLKNKNINGVNEFLKKNKYDYLIYKNNELIEKMGKRDNVIIHDFDLTNEEYNRKETYEIIKKYKRGTKYVNYIFIGYDLIKDESANYKLIKNHCKYHLTLYETIITLN